MNSISFYFVCSCHNSFGDLLDPLQFKSERKGFTREKKQEQKV